MTKSVVIEFYKCFSITSGLQPFKNSRLCRNHSEEKLPLSMPVGIWTTDTLQINWSMRGKSPLLCGTSCPRHGTWVNVIFTSGDGRRMTPIFSFPDFLAERNVEKEKENFDHFRWQFRQLACWTFFSFSSSAWPFVSVVRPALVLLPRLVVVSL